MLRVGRAAPRPETTRKKKLTSSDKLIEVRDVNGNLRQAKAIHFDPKYPGFMKITYRNHFEWYSIPEFIQYNPNLKSYTEGAPEMPEDVVGVVSSGGKDYLRDSTQNWLENHYTGYYAWISRGKGEGQKRTVTGNTHNKIIVDKPWDIPPDKTSQYVISYNVHDVRAMGNTLPAIDLKEFEKIAIERDKSAGRFTPDRAAQIIKYLKADEV